MGATYAGVTLLADAIESARLFVIVFIRVYILLIFVYVLSSWIRVPYALQPLVRFLHDVCEPYLRLFRRVIPPLGPVDVAPIVAVFVLIFLERVITSALLDNLR